MHFLIYDTFLKKIVEIVESFDTEDWSNGNFATTGINYILKYIKIENCLILICNVIKKTTTLKRIITRSKWKTEKCKCENLFLKEFGLLQEV